MKNCPKCGFDLGSVRPPVGTPVQVLWRGWQDTKVKEWGSDPAVFWVELHAGQAGPIACTMGWEGKQWRRIPIPPS